MSRRARVGIFGGSFDPIHRGHVAPVLLASEQLQLDRVLYLPTARPPHKRGRRFAGALHRLAMVELALLDQPQLRVDPMELDDAVHYTIDTIRALSRRESEAKLYLFLGADSLLEFDQWREWREIAAGCELVVMRRPGYPLDRNRWPESLRDELGPEKVHVLDNPLWHVSSTALREQFAGVPGNSPGEESARSGPSPESLHPRVLRYIQKYGLYSSS